MLRPAVILDLIANFTAYATDKRKRRVKVIARYQQYEGANKIVERVLAGAPKKGLIWHFQGSGKSLLMLFAARKLRLHPELKNPTVSSSATSERRNPGHWLPQPVRRMWRCPSGAIWKESKDTPCRDRPRAHACNPVRAK